MRFPVILIVVFAVLVSPALAQYPPQIEDIQASTHPPLPPATQQLCIPNPNTGARAPTCPVVMVNGYSVWAHSYLDNRIAMAISMYDPTGKLVKVWELPGARYVWQVAIDNQNQRVVFTGQGQGAVSIKWDELANQTAPGAVAVVNATQQQVNCIYSSSCGSQTTNASTAPIAMPGGASGTALMETITFPAAAGSPAAGKYGYEYRVNMQNAVNETEVACVTDITIVFGPNTQLNFDGSGPSDAYVTNRSSSGSIGVLSATRSGNAVNFVFEQPVCAGATPGTGKSSNYIGLVSASQPKAVTVTLGWPATLGIPASSYGPAF